MLRAVVVLALAVLACAPVRADEFESYRPQFVQACVEAAGADQDALRRCTGAGAAACIEAEGSNTMSQVLCWSHEADTWRELADRATAHLNARVSRDPQRLAAANAAWQTWADAECEYWAWEEGGGSGEQVDRAQCHARVTAERAITLIAAGEQP